MENGAQECDNKTKRLPGRPGGRFGASLQLAYNIGTGRHASLCGLPFDALSNRCGQGDQHADGAVVLFHGAKSGLVGVSVKIFLCPRLSGVVAQGDDLLPAGPASLTN